MFSCLYSVAGLQWVGILQPDTVKIALSISNKLLHCSMIHLSCTLAKVSFHAQWTLGEQFGYNTIHSKLQHLFRIILQGSMCDPRKKLGVVFFKEPSCEAGVGIHLSLEEIQSSPTYFHFLPNLGLWMTKMEGLLSLIFFFHHHCTIDSEICVRFAIS